MNLKDKSPGLASFSGMFWLVILFEFIERGSYYGVMSYISVYLVDLKIPKESIGIIKGVIQPLLYFLPIVSGAIADRFGYKKILLAAFSLMGLGYFLTGQAEHYGPLLTGQENLFGPVFIALVIMGIGAGLFKPLISGTIAKLTTEKNSTLGFGIYYWSINIGAFLFPTILVYVLKAINPTYPIILAAICTASMIIPTALFFRDPVKKQKADIGSQSNLIQTLANAFEIIYSPIMLLYYKMKQSRLMRTILVLMLIVLLGLSLKKYSEIHNPSGNFSKFGVKQGELTFIVNVDRNMLGKPDFSAEPDTLEPSRILLTIFKPEKLTNFQDTLLTAIHRYQGFENIQISHIHDWIRLSDNMIHIEVREDPDLEKPFTIQTVDQANYRLTVADHALSDENTKALTAEAKRIPMLAGISSWEWNHLIDALDKRSFFPLFVIALICIGLISILLSNRQHADKSGKSGGNASVIIILVLGAALWFIPGLTLLSRVITFTIYLTITSLFLIDKSNPDKFVDHAKFLLMIFIYSGFWVLYFQMFDSVLWYVQAYVDGGPLNHAVNSMLGFLGLDIKWRFAVEHVTAVNAGTIIILQLLVSSIVKKRKALPTMMVGIVMGILGMAILALGYSIWIFIIGIIIFSIGEMTAHPKFISYIGLIAPRDNKAMYMGYLFLYGVFGSSIGAITGAKLYVHFVDNLHQPKTLWLVFCCIGVVTLIGLALFNRFVKPKTVSEQK